MKKHFVPKSETMELAKEINDSLDACCFSDIEFDIAKALEDGRKKMAEVQEKVIEGVWQAADMEREVIREEIEMLLDNEGVPLPPNETKLIEQLKAFLQERSIQEMEASLAHKGKS